ncbi:hypothetical protein RB5145 [Rhodopirellula baltica SH 1]|uniref:Uncharacterized protein n=1 Tax=Rhodopirellula baltica (strain DSM 10527 / NCIMB 13988 / SH1) TaxID=243090 RepID=Q7UGL6_RHOBA|nr:hypothetical protein RB5145 [Rhodopirellula baltica SH 1]
MNKSAGQSRRTRFHVWRNPLDFRNDLRHGGLRPPFFWAPPQSTGSEFQPWSLGLPANAGSHAASVLLNDPATMTKHSRI